jgi:hypothetical protein
MPNGTLASSAAPSLDPAYPCTLTELAAVSGALTAGRGATPDPEATKAVLDSIVASSPRCGKCLIDCVITADPGSCAAGCNSAMAAGATFPPAAAGAAGAVAASPASGGAVNRSTSDAAEPKPAGANVTGHASAVPAPLAAATTAPAAVGACAGSALVASVAEVALAAMAANQSRMLTALGALSARSGQDPTGPCARCVVAALGGGGGGVWANGTDRGGAGVNATHDEMLLVLGCVGARHRLARAIGCTASGLGRVLAAAASRRVCAGSAPAGVCKPVRVRARVCGTVCV